LPTGGFSKLRLSAIHCVRLKGLLIMSSLLSQ
jgi:hypothetical protein